MGRRRDLLLAVGGDAEPRQQLELNGWERIRRGWYATAEADPAVRRAVTAGAWLTCLSAARWHGLWLPPGDERLHVLVRRRRSRQRDVPAGMVSHAVERWPGDAPVTDVVTTLGQVIACADAETSLIIVESALNQGKVSAADVEMLVRAAPEKKSRVLTWAVDCAQSGTETRLRLFFLRRRVPATPQALIAGVGRVDLLVGSSLIVEADSRAHHTGEQTYRADRRRDLIAGQLGYRVLRLTWEAVFLDWEATRSVLSAALHRRWHRQNLRPLASS